MSDSQRVIDDPKRYEEYVRRTADTPERRLAERALKEIAGRVEAELTLAKALCEEHMLDFEAKVGDGYHGEVSVRYNGLPVLEEEPNGHYDHVTHKFVPDGSVNVYIHFPYDQKPGWEAGNEEYWQSSSRGC